MASKLAKIVMVAMTVQDSVIALCYASEANWKFAAYWFLVGAINAVC